MRKILSIFFSRIAVAALLIIAEIVLFLVLIVEFDVVFSYFYWCCFALSVLVSIWIVSTNSDPGYKIAWIIPILAIPFFGGPLYLLLGGNRLPSITRHKLMRMEATMKENLGSHHRADALAQVAGEDAGCMSRYMEDAAFCPPYGNTESTYFPVGELCYARMLEELEKAQRYIFLEYFIISEGQMVDGILDVLKRKVAEGVDVRIIYDDLGSVFTRQSFFTKVLPKIGVKCVCFNRFIPIVSTKLNNRDHRKFCIIDGQVGFTGGINLADEYINVDPPYGHWKDSAILLRGDAVWSFTVMFLSMWDFITGQTEDLSRYRPQPFGCPGSETGYVQPYSDSPWDTEPVGETVYLNIISRARRYVYIDTPYLIIDHTMQMALTTAAKSGVDVRILTPHIPDKKTVFELTRAHYPALIRAGVKLYEYTPGFVHTKNFVSDDRFATVGTVNLDYRSMFLHFENGVWLCDAPCIKDIKADFLDTLPACEEITLDSYAALSLSRRFLRAVLRIFAPLM